MNASSCDVTLARTDIPGLKTCEPRLGSDGGNARGIWTACEEGRWFSFRWRIARGGDWAMRDGVAEDLEALAFLGLPANGSRCWPDAEEPWPDPDGRLDVELGAAHFSNTRLIGRLDLWPGQTNEIRTARVPLPCLERQPARQIYTCPGRDADGATWRHEEEAGGRFDAFRTDAEGFVTTYPGLFERVQP